MYNTVLRFLIDKSFQDSNSTVIMIVYFIFSREQSESNPRTF
jgi:hypothetical protein